MNEINPQPNTASQQSRRLYRSLDGKLLGGVCSGFADYFNLDVTLVRILWVLVTLLGGAGLIFYLICWLVIPIKPGQVTSPPRRNSGSILLGIILIALGFILLMGWSLRHCLWLPLTVHVWALPGSLIILGIILLLVFLLTRSQQHQKESPEVYTPLETKKGDRTVNRLYRSRDQRMLSGICGGLAKYFNIDATIVRILWVVLGIGSFGTALILYIILIFIIPEEPTA